jgi:hypothetical protein
MRNHDLVREKRQSYDEKGLLKQHFGNRRPHTVSRHNENVRSIGRRQNAKEVRAEFLIGEALD